MKKFILLPLVAAMALAGCSSNDSSSENPNVEVSDVSSAWQTEVQQTQMPSSMTSAPQATYSAPQPTYSAPQPTYSAPTPAPQPVPQPTYGASVQQPTYSQPQPRAAQPVANTASVSTEMVGNCQVVRDMNNAPVYGQMQKGCYTGSNYTVGKSDTVYLISYLTGTSVSNIATLNGLSQPYNLKVGQILRIR